MKLNETIIKIRVELQNSKLKMSGKNSHAGFTYFELSDFLPRLNELMLENGINDNFTIVDNVATLKLIKEDEEQSYCMPFVMFEVPLTSKGGLMMQQIQYLGALNTYYKRYLYLNAFGITDGEIIDGLNNEDIAPQPQKQARIYATKEQATELAKIAKETNQDINEVTKFFKVEGLMKLTDKQFFLAKRKLEAKEFIR